MFRKTILIIGIAALGIVGYAACLAAFGQATDQAGVNPRNQTRYYVFIYRPGPAWVKGKSIRGQPSLEGHFAHMTKLEEDGQLVLGGPFKDNSGSMGVVAFENLESAKKAVANDPMVQAKVFTAEVHAWHPAVTGCVEERPWRPACLQPRPCANLALCMQLDVSCRNSLDPVVGQVAFADSSNSS